MPAFRPRRPHAFALGVLAGVLLVPAITVAGTGVGAVFNLGRTNTVNSTTTLTGSTSSRMLQVTNGGTGPALRLTTRAGVAPMQVSSTGRVANLNADLLDGVDSRALVRGDGTNVEQVLHGRVVLVWNTTQPLLAVPAFGTLEASCTLSLAGQPNFSLFWRSSAPSAEDVIAIDSVNNNAVVTQLAAAGDGVGFAQTANGLTRSASVSVSLLSGATANVTVQGAVFTSGGGGCALVGQSISG